MSDIDEKLDNIDASIARLNQTLTGILEYLLRKERKEMGF